jgi:hypothetical protein
MWFQVKKLTVVVWISRGKRGGLNELLAVLDPDQALEVDQMIVYNNYTFQTGQLIGLVDRVQLKASIAKDAEAAIWSCFSQLLSKAESPGFEAKLRKLERVPRPQLHMVDGGLPSLGVHNK